MKFCTHCGKELLDEAVVCPGCGCAVENKEIKLSKKISTFKKNKKLWIIVLSILFVVFAGVASLLLTSEEFVRANDLYRFLHSELGQLGADWQQRVDAAKDTLIPYYVGIGMSSVLALAALVGDVILFVNRKKV